MKKPKPVYYNYTICLGQTRKGELAKVHEDFYSEHFMEIGDKLKCSRNVLLMDDYYIFDGLTNKEQTIAAKKLSKFFDQYAKWIAIQAEGEEGTNER